MELRDYINTNFPGLVLKQAFIINGIIVFILIWPRDCINCKMIQTI